MTRVRGFTAGNSVCGRASSSHVRSDVHRPHSGAYCPCPGTDHESNWGFVEQIRIPAAAGALCLVLVACAPASWDDKPRPQRPEENALKVAAPDSLTAFDKEPELVSMDRPDYPDAARENGVQGIVHMRVLVGTDGFVKMLEEGYEDQLSQPYLELYVKDDP